MRKVIALLLAAIFLLAVAVGCSDKSTPATSDTPEQPSASTGSGKTYTNVKDENDIIVAHIHGNAGIQASALTEEGFQKALQERGLKWQVDVTDAADDVGNLVRAIEDSVAKRVDAIVIDYTDMRPTASALKLAYDAGIPVITIDAGGFFPNTLCDVTTNNYEGASKLSVWVVNRMGPTGNVIIMDLDISAGVRQRTGTFRAVLDENPGINILEDYVVDVTRVQQDTMDAMETYLLKYGIDGIDMVYCGWDEAAYAVSKVLDERGYTSDDCFVTGFDGHWDVALSYFQQNPKWPQQASVHQSFGSYGKIAADLIYKVCVQGRDWDDATNGKTNIYVRGPLITVDNVAGLTKATLSPLTSDFYYGDYTSMSDYIFSYDE